MVTDELADLGSKDAAMQMRGAWGIELSELSSMERIDVERVKSFVTRQKDRFRPPYARHLLEAPRQCMFIGTTNKDAYLKDPTGGRRFWPVHCRTVDIAGLRNVKDQLWAEAVVRFKDGANWWFDSANQELQQHAEEEQTSRLDGDPWQSLIQEYLVGRNEVSTADILKHCIGKSKDQWSRSDQMRVGSSLRALKWERFKKRVGSTSEWIYKAQ